MFCIHHTKTQEAKTCKFRNKGKEYEANEGEVVQLKKTKLRVCENGKTVLKKKTEFKFPYNFACKGKVRCILYFVQPTLKLLNEMLMISNSHYISRFEHVSPIV